MAKITLYGDANCPYCGAARMLLTKKGVTWEDIAVHTDADKRAEMERRSGRTSVPQIFIDEHYVGGFEELLALDKSGELDKLLAAS